MYPRDATEISIYLTQHTASIEIGWLRIRMPPKRLFLDPCRAGVISHSSSSDHCTISDAIEDVTALHSSEVRSSQLNGGGSEWGSNPSVTGNLPPAGFEDRESHRTPRASVLYCRDLRGPPLLSDRRRAYFAIDFDPTAKNSSSNSGSGRAIAPERR
jgi:hypothetical protein